MSIISLSSSPATTRPFSAGAIPTRLFAGMASRVRRAVTAWRAVRSQRVLSSLSYDTLKDIGYPSAGDERNMF
jgi:uncharacterized protein YjiS (DUF1127 family)